MTERKAFSGTLLSAAPVLLAALVLSASWPGLSAQAAADAPALVRRAAEARLAEDWFGAIELYLAALQVNPAYTDAVQGLAESYYALEEYGQALTRVAEARRLKGDDPALLSMEAFIRIGLGEAEKAAELFRSVLARFPNDLEARFGLALLDLRSGRSTDARARLAESLRISPRNARALLSLALISADAGRDRDADAYIENALRFHSQDARTQYVAARLASRGGRVKEAIDRARSALEIRPSYGEARRLLASLLLESGDPGTAAQLMESAVARDRSDSLAWYTLGIARSRMGQTDPGVYAFEAALALRPDDEVARRALEDLVIDATPVEDARRSRIAADRFARGRQFESNREYERALAEYRRGLKVDPYSKPGRERYAELLRLRGKPSSYLAELEFLKSLDKADGRILDAAENYASALTGAVGRSWGLDQLLLAKRPYKLALYSLPAQGPAYHPGVGKVLTRALRDETARSARFQVNSEVGAASSFADAFRSARASGADWFGLVKTEETERDVRLTLDVYVARTGSPAASFSSLRSGNERVSRAVFHLAGLLESAPPLRGTLLRRNGDRVLVDLGRNDGLAQGDTLLVVRSGSLAPSPQGIDIAYRLSDVTGEIEITRTDEEVSEGNLRRSGYLDRSNLGDSVVRKPVPPESKNEGASPAEGKAASAGPAAPSEAVSPGEPVWPGLFDEIRRLR